MSELLPTVQAGEIKAGLLDYLTTTFALADPDAQLALEEFLSDREHGIFKGPYLRLRLPFRPAEDGSGSDRTGTRQRHSPGSAALISDQASPGLCRLW